MTQVSDLCIIDVDAHITEPADLWTSRAPSAYRDRVPRVVHESGAAKWQVDGVVLGKASGGSVIGSGRQKSRGVDFIQWQLDDIDPSSYDMHERVKVLDELGIWAQILYPNAAGFGSQRFGEVIDPTLRNLCASIYNDAMSEIQSESNGRLLPMALLPWWDVDASVAEAERIAALGLRGVNMCSDPQHHGIPDLGEDAWNPLWERCADLRLPVNFHIGASGTAMSWFGDSPWPSQDDERKLAIGSSMIYLSNARVIANLVFSGVFERFPALRVVSVESGVGWIPFFLESLDYQQSESAPHSLAQLSMKPSDYVRRQVYGCFWFEVDGVPHALSSLGPERIMFETDYPHPTCLYPDPIGRLAGLRDEIGDAVFRRVVQDNAADLYRVDTTR